MPDKAILLDIDGVLVTTPPWKPAEFEKDGFMKFNERAAGHLSSLLLQTGAAIILITSHRNSYRKPEWRELLFFRLKYAAEVHIIEEFIPPVSSFSRVEQLVCWAEGAGTQTAYVIIDDDASLESLPEHIRSRWVRTRPLIGFDKQGYEQALRLLGAD